MKIHFFTNYDTCLLKELLLLSDSGTWGDEASEDNGAPVLRSTNIQNNSLLLDDVAYRAIPDNDTQRKRLEDGDVLVTTSSGSPKHIGKCCIFEQPKDSQAYYFSNFTRRLRVARKKLEPQWLFYWLTSAAGRFALRTMNDTTTGLRNINISRYLEQEVPLPPLSKQTRIAAILDKADAIRKKRKQAIQLTEDLLRSVFLDMFGDPVTNPKGWETKTLEDIVDFRTGKLDSNAAVKGGKYPFFTCSKETYAIDQYAFDCEALLLAGNNANAEYSIKHYKGKFNAYQRTYVITLKGEGNSYYYMKMTLEFKLEEMKRISKGTNTRYLTLGLLNNINLQVPDPDTQKKYELLVRDILATSESQSDAFEGTDDLFNSLVQRAFKGEL